MYAGHEDVNNTFFMVHCNEDDLPDMTSMLGNSEKGIASLDGMTVFAFGRGEGVERFLKERQKFVIGMYPKKIGDKSDHQELSEFIERNIINH